MLIIPLGMEGGAVFRLPVISILVGVACLVGFVLSVPMLQESTQHESRLVETMTLPHARSLYLSHYLRRLFLAQTTRHDSIIPVELLYAGQ